MALLRLRLYHTLISLPPGAFEGSFFVVRTTVKVEHSQPLPLHSPPPSPPPCCGTGCLSGILRELVGEFSLSTNISATTTSLMKTLVDFDVGMVLEAWSRETDHQALEQQVHMQSTNATQDCRHHKKLSSLPSLPLPSPPLPPFSPLPSPPPSPLPSALLPCCLIPSPPFPPLAAGAPQRCWCRLP